MSNNNKPTAIAVGFVFIGSKNISKIDYNFLNLPNKLDYSRNDIESVSVQTKYSGDGTKLQKQNATTVFGIVGYTTLKKVTDYLDGFQYLQTINPPGGGWSESLMANMETARALEIQVYTRDTLEPQLTPATLNSKTADLQFFPTAEGFYDYIKDQYIYQYKDHLGNVRVSFGRNSAGALEITDANDYYPFGMNHLKSGNSIFGAGKYQNYKYNGKELQESGCMIMGQGFICRILEDGAWWIIRWLRNIKDFHHITIRLIIH